MATIAEEEKKKRGSYGDAAAAALDSDVTQLKYGKPGDFPVNPDGTPMQKMGFGPSAAAPTAPTAPAAPALSAPTEKPPAYSTSTLAKPEQPQSDYARQMKEVGGFLVDTPIKAIKTLVSAPGYGFSKPDDPQQAATQPAPAAVPDAQAAPKPVVPAPSAAPAPVVAPAAVAESAPDGSPKVNDPGQVTSADRMAMDAKAHADELASIKLRQQIQDGGAPAEGFTPATIRHSGNDWQARNNLRNLEVSASSMTAQPKDLMAYEIARKHDTQLQGGSTAADVANVAAVNRHNEINSTAQVANARTAQQGQQFGASQELAKQRLALDSKTQGAQAAQYGAEARLKGVQANAAEQLAALQNKYMTAKPEEQAAIAKQIQTLSNKADKVQLHTVNQPDTMAPDGMTKLGGGQRLVVQGADGSFHEVPVGGQQQAQQAGPPVISSPEQLAKLQKGTVFIGPDGKQRRKD